MAGSQHQMVEPTHVGGLHPASSENHGRQPSYIGNSRWYMMHQQRRSIRVLGAAARKASARVSKTTSSADI